MDGKIQTSFIPKTPIGAPEIKRKSGANLFLTGSIFIFIVSLALAGAVFGGRKYLTAELVKDKEAFTEARSRFDSVTVDYLVKLNNKMKVAKDILGNHISILSVFNYLEQNTYKAVRFNGMELSISDNNSIELSMKGLAKDFQSVALQSDLFGGNKDFKNPILSDVDMAVGGGVTFNFKTQIDPRLVLYKNTRGLQQ